MERMLINRWQKNYRAETRFMNLKKLTISIIVAIVFAVQSHAGTETHREAVLELLEVTNAEQMVDQMLNSIEGMMNQQFAAMNLPEEGVIQAQKLGDEMTDWLRSVLIWDDVKEMYVDLYVDVFTEQEIHELVDFYRSPLGQKLQEKMPALMQKSMQLGQQLAMAKMPELQAKMQAAIAELQSEYSDKE